MFGLTVAQENALLSVARSCNQEIKEEFKKNSQINRDKISRPIILRHYQKLKPMGIKLEHLLYKLGVLNGRLTER